MQTVRSRVAVALLVATLPLTGCAVHEPVPSSPSAAADFARLVDIGDGRSLYAECHGSGSPTVLLLGGLRSASDYWHRTGQEDAVFDSVARLTRVCSYDRPGTVREGNQFSPSDGLAQPTAERAALTDLLALLAATSESGPFVVAAHSYGGFIGRMFAAEHPESVKGLVLIDALSEGFQDALSPAHYEAWKATMQTPAEDIAAYPAIERLDLDTVMSEIRAVPMIDPSLPLVVVSADATYGGAWPGMVADGALPVGTPVELGYAIDAAQKHSQKYLADLTPNAAHITSTRSGHDIPLERPELVVDAIRDLVVRAR